MVQITVRQPVLPARYDDLTPAQRKVVSMAYVRLQGGLCKHCAEPLGGPPTAVVEQARLNARVFPPGFFDHPHHLHHDHRTGMTIGVVHAKCNAYLWQYHGE